MNDLAIKFNTSPQYVWTHFQRHTKLMERDGEYILQAQPKIEAINQLLNKIFWQLQERLFILMQTSPGTNEKIIATISKEVRELALTIDKLRGELKQTPVIQIQQMNIQMNKLSQFLVSKLCPKCLQKTTQYLEEIVIDQSDG